MFELFTEQLEIHKRKQPIKTSDRFDFLGVVIIAMFNVFVANITKWWYNEFIEDEIN